jgi:hypothetical protein
MYNRPSTGLHDFASKCHQQLRARYPHVWLKQLREEEKPTAQKKPKTLQLKSLDAFVETMATYTQNCESGRLTLMQRDFAQEALWKKHAQQVELGGDDMFAREAQYEEQAAAGIITEKQFLEIKGILWEQHTKELLMLD